MKYDQNNNFKNAVNALLQASGTDIDGLCGLLGLAEGTLDIMLQYGAQPPQELTERMSRISGMTEKHLVLGEESHVAFEVPRKIFVLKDAEFVKPYLDVENVLCQLYIDRPSTDKRNYIGLRVNDDSMSRAHIHKGDTAIMRCQAIAEDGDIVVAEVEGKTVIRRYNCKKDIIWLSAEGYVGDEPVHYTDCLNAVNRKIKIYGRVVSVVRDF